MKMTPNESPNDAAGDEPPRQGHGSDGDVSELERTLTERGEAYARVTIVRREPPVSANVGDRAVVTRDGELHGWIGGVACAQTTTVTEATAAIEAGEPRLVGIAPDPDEIDRPGLEAFPMRCHSEGVLELFIEPVNLTLELLIVGASPVARSLARLAAELTIDVTLVDSTNEDADDLPPGTSVTTTTDPTELAERVGASPLVVVASMGQYDARGVAAGVRADAPYVGLVASDTRSTEVIERAADLLDRDPETVREAVTNPAGVDIAARTPAEIAATLLAELVDARATAGAPEPQPTAADSSGSEDEDDSTATGAAATDEPAIDPVCGMTVDPDEAAANVDHEGEVYYFCCHGCADSFRIDPASYLDASEEESTASP